MKLTKRQLKRIIRECVLLESNYTVSMEIPSLVKKIKTIAYELGRRGVGIASELPREFHYGDMHAITAVMSYKDQDGTTSKMIVDLPKFLEGTETPWSSIDPFERDMFTTDLLEAFPGSKRKSNSIIELNTKDSGKYFKKRSFMGMIPGSIKF